MRQTGYMLILIATLCAGFLAPKSFAWELRLQGGYDFNYEYYAQLGSNGFFGPYDVSSSSFGAPYEANSNAWLGIETLYSLFQGQHPGAVSGSDASVQTVDMHIDGEFELNKAVKVRARYRIGGSNVGNNDLLDYTWEDFGPGFNTKYFTSTTPGKNNPQSYGEWTMLWVEATTPWAVVSFGKKPFAVGCGLQYNCEDLTEESLLLRAHYGPFRFGAGFYPMTLGHHDFFDLQRRWTVARSLIWLFRDAYYHPSFLWDKTGRPDKFMTFVSYAGGPLKIGLGTIYTSLHFGYEGALVPVPNFVDLPTLDQTDWEGWIYAKYSNGRFFLNAEADFFNRVRTLQPTATGNIWSIPPVNDGGGDIFAPQYVESWKWMVETGVLTGPAKLSLLCAFLPGPDRRHGVLIDRQPTTYPVAMNWDPRFSVSLLNRHVGNSGLFRPYSLLFAYDYGSGLNCIDLNGNGCVTDASVLAARLDYAMAANLNVYCSFLYAERASHGWQWGCIWPEDRELIFTPQQNAFDPDLDYVNPVPTIPDRDLGWEVNMGGNWELLENLVLNVTAAYWQPGRWFNYACIDRSVTDWDDPNPGNNWGVNPNRKIDPILGLRINALAEF